MSVQWSDEMLRNWSEAQKRYWDAWSELSRMGQPSASAQPNTATWTQGMEQWWQAVEKNMLPGATTDAFRRMVDMGKVYMDMAESAYRGQQNGVNSAEVIEAWMNAMESGLRGCCTQLDLGKFTAHGFGVGQTALESWQKVVKSLGLDLFQHMGAGGFQMPVSQNWQEQLSKLLATPALGLNRESQERQQALLQLFIQYQEALDDYLKAFAKQGLASVDALRARVAQLKADGKSIQSLRELYDLWVDVNEEVYGKFAMTDEYQVVYGDMVNALMALKQGINAEMDTVYEALNLPTRKELNTAFQKQQETRRETRALRQQVQELARKLEALTAAQATATQTAPANPAIIASEAALSAKAAKPRRSKQA